MLSSAFLIQLGKKEKYEKLCRCDCPGDEDTSSYGKTTIRKEVIIFVLLVLLDISLLIYTLYCLMALNLRWYMTLLLIGGMFLPGVGIGVQLAIIGYYTFKGISTISTSKPLPRNKLGQRL